MLVWSMHKLGLGRFFLALLLGRWCQRNMQIHTINKNQGNVCLDTYEYVNTFNLTHVCPRDEAIFVN